MTINVCVAGATGWIGRPIAEAVLASDDLALRSAVSRSAAGQDLGTAWGGDPFGVAVHGSVADALDGVDVLVDYTSGEVVRANTEAALDRGVSVVIGTSGMSAEDFVDIDRAATEAGVGVVASGNFSVTAAMARRRRCWLRAISRTGRSSTTPRPVSRTLRAVRRGNWPNAWAR